MTYTRLRYHFVWATKRRQPLISAEVERVIHRAIIEEAEEFGGYIIEQGGIDDHRHLIAAIPPTVTVSKAAGRLKAASCAAVRRRLHMPEFEWQVGYSCHTLNARDFGAACRYVQDQKIRHQRFDLIEAWENLDE